MVYLSRLEEVSVARDNVVSALRPELLRSELLNVRLKNKKEEEEEETRR